MTWKELQSQVLLREFALNAVEARLPDIGNRDQEATGKAVSLISDVVRAVENLCGDPSDGPFLTQEPEEPDGFCDCPECCGE